MMQVAHNQTGMIFRWRARSVTAGVAPLGEAVARNISSAGDFMVLQEVLDQ